jgi:hypothetical protein
MSPMTRRPSPYVADLIVNRFPVGVEDVTDAIAVDSVAVLRLFAAQAVPEVGLLR